MNLLQAVRGLNRFPLAYLLLTELRWFGKYDDKSAGDDPMMRLALVNCVKYRNLYNVRSCCVYRLLWFGSRKEIMRYLLLCRAY